MMTALTETTDTAAALGRRMALARRELGWTQEVLGEKAGGLNRETIMRIEKGGDARITTIAKIRRVLPGLDGPSRREQLHEDLETMQLEDFATRISHLVQGLTSIERLHKVRAFVLSQLMEEQQELDPHSLIHLHRKQEAAEQQLIAKVQRRNNKRKPNGKTGGDGRH